MTTKDRRPLLTPRAAMVLLLSGLAGAAAAWLAVLAGENTASSMLVAGTATGGAIYLFNSILQ